MNLLELGWIFLTDPLNLSLSLGSILMALLVLWWSRNSGLSVAKRVFLIYAHIAFLIVPVALFAYASGCALPASDCTVKTALYAMPFILAGVITTAGVLGYFVMPRLYRRRMGARALRGPLARFVAQQADKHGLRAPSLHVIDSAVPQAFSFSSFKPAIFISAGMLDILSANEVKAVLLHELGHLAHRSSLLKFSATLAHAVSPVAKFASMHHALDREECEADRFATTIQGTHRHLESARRKVEGFLAFSE
ncbi:M48 family metalloprotease [Candidatus Woesearchaeota archaeon]|nr:M48 family metalloprotease [Candidatus Woesearchaeota archaeon]